MRISMGAQKTGDTHIWKRGAMNRENISQFLNTAKLCRDWFFKNSQPTNQPTNNPQKQRVPAPKCSPRSSVETEYQSLNVWKWSRRAAYSIRMILEPAHTTYNPQDSLRRTDVSCTSICLLSSEVIRVFLTFCVVSVLHCSTSSPDRFVLSSRGGFLEESERKGKDG